MRHSSDSEQPPSQKRLSELTASDETNRLSSLLTRRNLLLLSGAGFAALTAPRWLKHVTAQNPSLKALSDKDAITTAQENDFLVLSMLLTSRQNLHPETSARIYTALNAQSSAFQQQATALLKYAQTHQLKDVDALVNAIKTNAGLAQSKTAMLNIISAWYLGIVDDGEHRKVIAFESALMFDQVRDAVVVPTYCRAAFGYWVTQPTAL